VKLNISNNSGESSSIFDLGQYKDIWPEVGYVNQLQLESETLDGLVGRGIFPAAIDAIILDTQGSELLVLKGAQATLRQALYVKVEAADFESYRGGATVDTITEFLERFSFKLERKGKFASHPCSGAYYDLLFKRFCAGRLRTIKRSNPVRSTFKSFARRLFSERTLGMIDYYLFYYRFPRRNPDWEGPFNGQAQRAKIFKAIVGQVRPAAILETGTYAGTTTEFMAEGSIPVYTIENSPRFYHFARARLQPKRNVTVRLGDSRTELRALFEGPLRSVKHKVVFVYLDAHWKDDLPLAEELDIVFQNCPAAVVMIDDFQVPDDPGYAYDDYGPGKALTLSYIAPTIASLGLRVFYPSTRSSEEGGARRGCVVLVKNGVHSQQLGSCPLLRAVE
jgi:hypothetical protein